MAALSNSTDQRRDFIIEQVQRKGMVTLKEIRARYVDYKSPNSMQDGKFFAKLPAIEIKKRRLVSSGHDTVEQR